MTIHQILERFRQDASSNVDLGDKFERLIADYLRLDPIYSERFEDVWLWPEWPDRSGHDIGIDLVARERRTGEYCAIQCKFYDPAQQLQKEHIDSFFTASGKMFPTTKGKQHFTSRIIVSTTDKWSKHAEDALANQTIPVSRLGVQDLSQSPIDWSQFDPDHPSKLKLRKKKTPLPHQNIAIGKVIEAFKAQSRGKLIMACGTGKTFTSLRIAEALTGGTGLVLALVPSISLLSQTLREWTAESTKTFHAFAVCSDTKVGKHQEDMSAHDLAIPATTDAKRLAAAMKIHHGKREMTVIFSTYQSIGVVADAQAQGMPDFDLIVCDEAHLYLPKKDGKNPVEQRAVENFEKIAKEGRKYGVALMIVSQRPSDVSSTILSQCNNIIALRLTNSDDQATVRKLMPESLDGLMDMLPILDIGEALVVGDAVLLPSRIRIQPPNEKPLSATIDFWDEWTKLPETPDFVKAVENMRRQNRN